MIRRPPVGDLAARLPLKHRLALWVGLLAMAATALVSTLTSHVVESQIEADQGNLLRQIALDLSGELAQDLANRAEQLGFAATDATIRDPAATPAARAAVLARLAQAQPVFTWLGMTDSEGRIIVSTRPEILGQSVAQRDWFTRGRRALHFGDAHEAKLLAGYLPRPKWDALPLRLVDIALPVRDGEGRTIGVLAAHLSLDWAFDERQRLLDRTGDYDIDVAVLNGSGALLIGRDSLVPMAERVGSLIAPARPGAGRGAGVRVWPDDNRRYLTASVAVSGRESFPGLGWTVVARKSADLAFASVAALRLRIALWGAAVCMLFLACLWWVLDRETRPLKRLGAVAARIAQHAPDTPIQLPEGHGEIATFTRSLVRLVDALQRSRAGYRHLFENAPVALCHADVQGRVLEINRRFVQELGYEREDVPTLETLWHLACSEDADRDRLRSATGHASEKAADIDAGERILRHKNGEERTMQITGMVDVDGIIIALRDVSRERRAESELRLWMRAFEQARTGLALADARTNRFIAVNPAFAAERGSTVEDMVGRQVASIYPADRQADAHEAVAIVNRNGHHVFESEHLRADGSRFPVQLEMTSVDTERGDVVHRLAICHDISERKRVEAVLASTQAAALAAEHRARLATLNQMQDANAARARAEAALAAQRISQAQMSLFIEHAPAALAMFDRQMRYLEVSRRWRETLRLGGQTLIGESHYAVFPDIGEDRKAAHRRGLAGEVVRADRDRYLFADGTVLWMRWEVRPWRDEQGAIGGIVIFFEDITRQVAAEDEIRALNEDLETRVQERTAELTFANRELDSFAHAVTHDLRAPLRAMSGYARILEEDYGAELPPDARDLLRQVQHAGVRMGELIDAIFALSHVNRSELERTTVDLSAMSVRLFESLAGAGAAHRPEWRVEPGITVEGDRRMLESVMQNLIANAWKYTGKCARPTISVHTEVREGQRWTCVSDNGAGFSMVQADRLFAPFQRLHRLEDFPGIGIGLATVQRIIRRHGGEIIPQGEPGHGATFRFWLPENLNPNRARTVPTSVLAA